VRQKKEVTKLVPPGSIKREELMQTCNIGEARTHLSRLVEQPAWLRVKEYWSAGVSPASCFFCGRDARAPS
ncbi:MAG: hypothetical protein LBQ62_04520, partial [Candidatus Accumulibacter sp.]|nr:hypothetical protein [Accumulibacter sp.]